MRAVLYVRQSLDRTGEGQAVERQRLACLELCRMRGWTVVDTITDNDMSATKGKRPGFADLLARVERREIDVVVVWHVDRLVRRLDELEQVISLCELTGVKLATVSGDLDLSTDAGRLVGRILASVARGEVERKGKRQREANGQRAAAGKPHAGGPRAFGYEQDGLTLVPHEADAIRDAYATVLGGGSLRSISREWNAQGLNSGKRRWGSRKDQPTEWRPDTVRDVLLNIRNAGIRSYQGEEFPAQWPAIVPDETYRAAAALLTDPQRRPPAPYGVSLLTGVAVCGVCGAGIHSGGGGRRGATQPNGTKRYRVYRCSTKVGTHIARRTDPIDQLVTRLTIEALSAPDAADLLVDHSKPDLPALRAEREAIRTRQTQLAEEFADGSLTAAQLRAANDRITARLRDVETAIADAGRLSILGPLIDAEDVQEAWDALDIDRKRAVLRELMIITVHPVGRGTRLFRPESVGIEWRVSAG